MFIFFYLNSNNSFWYVQGVNGKFYRLVLKGRCSRLKAARCWERCEQGHCHGEASTFSLTTGQSITSSHFQAIAANITKEAGIHSLACRDKFLMHNSFVVIKIDYHTPDTAFWLSDIFWSWWRWTFPLEQLLLCLQIITINPALLTSYDLGQEGFILWGEFWSSVQTSTCCCMHSAIRILGRKHDVNKRTSLVSTWVCLRNT